MEYLMSYGWAILIIAVVLGVLFQLGVFSGSALTPKAQPGSCTVQRLLGQVSLEGECQGQLPEYVGQFDGQTSYVQVADSSTLHVASAFTISVWANPTNTANYRGMVSKTSGAQPNPFDSYFNNGQSYVTFLVGNGGGNNGLSSPAGSVVFNTWQHYAFTYNGVTMSIYLNGQLVAGPTTVAISVTDGSVPMRIGNRNDGVTPMLGGLANVQIYNASLSSNEIKALYLEGIGGAPIKIQDLVGWWPLNGDVKDYSGNNNNGQVNGGVSFNGTWQGAYSPP